MALLPAVALLPVRIRTQTGCSTAQALRGVFSMVEHGLTCLCVLGQRGSQELGNLSQTHCNCNRLVEFADFWERQCAYKMGQGRLGDTDEIVAMDTAIVL